MRDVTMRTGLIKSLNVVTVDVAIQTGLAQVANTAQRFGLPRPNPYPALALGTTEATPLQMASAYAAFANGGRGVQPKVIAEPDQAPQGDQIDPETEELATGKCPQRELVAIASAQAPTSECFRHSIYFALPDDANQEVTTLASSESPRSTRPRQKYSSGEFAPLRDTHIETDTRGRSVLVNEMKVGGR